MKEPTSQQKTTPEVAKLLVAVVTIFMICYTSIFLLTNRLEVLFKQSTNSLMIMIVNYGVYLLAGYFLFPVSRHRWDNTCSKSRDVNRPVFMGSCLCLLGITQTFLLYPIVGTLFHGDMYESICSATILSLVFFFVGGTVIFSATENRGRMIDYINKKDTEKNLAAHSE